MVIAAAKSFQPNTVQELIAYAKRRPGEVSFGFYGVGGTNYLLPKKFEADNGIKLLEVPYRDASQMQVDLAVGRISLFFPSLTAILPAVNGGKVKMLAVSSKERLPNFADVPTFSEGGIDQMPSPWWGYGVRAGTPPEIIAKLHSIIHSASTAPEYAAMLRSTGSEPVITATPAAFQEFIGRQDERWGAIIKALNLKVDH